MFQDYTRQFQQIIEKLETVAQNQAQLQKMMTALEGLICFCAAVLLAQLIEELFDWIANKYEGRKSK